jgi:mRNA interferase MazF
VKNVDQWKSALRARLLEASRAREAESVAVIREVLGAIDNAEAADLAAAPPVQPGVIAGGVVGLGAAEVPRRVLSVQAVGEIVERQIQERRQAAATYEALGQATEASRLRRQIEVVASLAASAGGHEGVGAINRGDLFWIVLDEGRAAAPGVAHPHLVVQDDVFNHSRIETSVVCALTSNLERAKEPGNVLLDAGEGSLPQQSVVVVSQISSVQKTRLAQRIGALSEARVEQILAGLRFQQRSFFRK